MQYMKLKLLYGLRDFPIHIDIDPFTDGMEIFEYEVPTEFSFKIHELLFLNLFIPNDNQLRLELNNVQNES